MAGSEMITIVLVLAVGYWLFSTGKLDEIMGQFNIGNIGGGGGATAPEADIEAEPAAGGGGEEAYAESPDGPETDVSGENSGASVNGRCTGNPEQCRKAEEMLEMLKN